MTRADSANARSLRIAIRAALFPLRLVAAIASIIAGAARLLCARVMSAITANDI